MGVTVENVALIGIIILKPIIDTINELLSCLLHYDIALHLTSEAHQLSIKVQGCP